MSRRTIWKAGVWLYFVINGPGAVLALSMGEMRHAGVHAVLFVLGVSLFGRRLWQRREEAIPAQTGDSAFTEQLTHLEHSVDAVAIEVERIGEGQRFLTNFLNENGVRLPAREAAAEQVTRIS